MTQSSDGAITLCVSVDPRGALHLGSRGMSLAPDAEALLRHPVAGDGQGMTLYDFVVLFGSMRAMAQVAAEMQTEIGGIQEVSPQLSRLSRRSLTSRIRGRLEPMIERRRGYALKGVSVRVAMIAKSKLTRWEHKRKRRLLDAIRVTDSGYLDALASLRNTLMGAKVSFDISKCQIQMAWNAWTDWSPFVAVAYFVLLLSAKNKVAHGLGISRKVTKKISIVRERGQVELSLRFHFGEPGKPVTLDMSASVVDEILELWNICTDVVHDSPPSAAGSSGTEMGDESSQTSQELETTESAPTSSELAATPNEEPEPVEFIFPLPNVRISDGSLIVELLQDGSNWWGIQAMALMAFAIRVGPGLAGLPQDMRERWYRSEVSAERAKRSLETLRAEMVTETESDATRKAEIPIRRSRKRLMRESG
jgi:hypothetical protein